MQNNKMMICNKSDDCNSTSSDSNHDDDDDDDYDKEDFVVVRSSSSKSKYSCFHRLTKRACELDNRQIYAYIYKQGLRVLPRCRISDTQKKKKKKNKHNANIHIATYSQENHKAAKLQNCKIQTKKIKV